MIPSLVLRVGVFFWRKLLEGFTTNQIVIVVPNKPKQEERPHFHGDSAYLRVQFTHNFHNLPLGVVEIPF